MALTKDREDLRKIFYEIVAKLPQPPTAEESERRSAELARIRSRLAGTPNLRANVRERLIVLIDRIRGALDLMLVRLRTILSQLLDAPSYTLALIAVRLATDTATKVDECIFPAPAYALI